jgi:hypothetical protein
MEPLATDTLKKTCSLGKKYFSHPKEIPSKLQGTIPSLKTFKVAEGLF